LSIRLRFEPRRKVELLADFDVVAPEVSDILPHRPAPSSRIFPLVRYGRAGSQTGWSGAVVSEEMQEGGKSMKFEF
jgi:hypothetical protein